MNTRITAHAYERAVRDLNAAMTQQARRQVLKELPRRVLPAVRAHFASFPDCFPVGRHVTELIDRMTGVRHSRLLPGHCTGDWG